MMAQVPGFVVRRFSTSSARAQMVKLPTQVFGIEGRYASALYSAATKQKQLEVVEKDLKDLQSLLKKKGKFTDFLLDPSVKRSDKKNLLGGALGQTKASKLTGNLLTLLAENGRLNKLNGIASSFASIMSAHRGEVTCEVTTAKELNPQMKQELEAALKSFVKPGESVIITTKVDPDILGGMIVAIGDKYVDMSTASKIKKYSQLIQAAI